MLVYQRVLLEKTMVISIAMVFSMVIFHSYVKLPEAIAVKTVEKLVDFQGSHGVTR